MPFEEALKQIKKGQRVCRSGWNAKGMFTFLVGADVLPAKDYEAIKGLYPGDMVPHGSYMAMKTAQGNVMPWTPSQCDVLAEDWCLV